MLVVLVPLLVVQGIIYTAWYHPRWSEQERATLETAQEVAATFAAYIRDVSRQELAIGAALTARILTRPSKPVSFCWPPAETTLPSNPGVGPMPRAR